MLSSELHASQGVGRRKRGGGEEYLILLLFKAIFLTYRTFVKVRSRHKMKQKRAQRAWKFETLAQFLPSCLHRCCKSCRVAVPKHPETARLERPALGFGCLSLFCFLFFKQTRKSFFLKGGQNQVTTNFIIY